MVIITGNSAPSMPKPKPKPKKSIRRMTKHSSGLLTLPYEMLQAIARCLTKFDRQCLALTCKYMRDAICQGKTNVIDGSNSNKKRTKDFFLRLQKDWVPKNLKWCHHCGKFMTRDKAFWDELGVSYTNKAGGGLHQAWAYLIAKGKYGQLVEDWCNPKALRMNSAVKNCPKCTVSMARKRTWDWDWKH